MIKSDFKLIDLDCLVSLKTNKGVVKGRIIKYEEEGIFLKITPKRKALIRFEDIRDVKILWTNCKGQDKGYRVVDISIAFRDYYVERLGGYKKVRRLVQEWIMKEAMKGDF